MGACGGTVTTQQVVIGDEPIQILGELESRERVTLYADGNNTTNIYFTAQQGARFREGFPLVPGAVFVFDGRGARAKLFALTSGADGQRLYIITEGA